MFNFLREKLSKLTKSLEQKLKKPKVKEKEEAIERKVKEKGVVKKVVEKITRKVVERRLSEEEIESVLKEIEPELIDADVAYEVVQQIKEGLEAELAGREVRRGKERDFIINTLKKALLGILTVPQINLDEIIEKAKRERGYATLIFFGINGVGKSLNLTKVGYYLKGRGFKVLLAAGDTFRIAAIEQLEKYAEKAGLEVIKQRYGADSCAVIFDARKAAEARRYDVVLADTSGRMHVKKDLMDELAKIVRANKPDLKILVLDSLSGSDVLSQYKFFDEAVGIDAVIFTKVDVNEKGGNILSVCYNFRKPILFLGNGQGIGDLIPYQPEKFVDVLI